MRKKGPVKIKKSFYIDKELFERFTTIPDNVSEFRFANLSDLMREAVFEFTEKYLEKKKEK